MLLVKKSEKNPEDNKKNTKTGEMIFAKKNNKCSTSSHLRQGLCTFFWSPKFEFSMYLKTRVFLEEKENQPNIEAPLISCAGNFNPIVRNKSC